MHIEPITDWPVLRLSGHADPATLQALRDSGVVWPTPGGGLETRPWLLPAIKRRVGLTWQRNQDRSRVIEALTRVAEPGPFPPETPTGTITLKPHQVSGAGFLLRHSGAVLADDVGLGKTLQALAALRARTVPGLAVVLKSNLWHWHSEAVACGFLPRTILMADGSPAERRRAVASWTRASREGAAPLLLYGIGAILRDYPEIVRAVDHEGVGPDPHDRDPLGESDKAAVSAFPFAVIADDIAPLKNSTTSTWHALSSVGRYAVARWALNATPVENSAHDLHGVLEWVRPGWTGPQSAWTARYPVIRRIQKGPRQVPITVAWRHRDELRAQARELVLRRTADEVPGLPDLICMVQEVILSAAELAACRKAATHPDPQQAIRRGSQAAMWARLVDADYRGPAAKVEALRDLLDSCPDKVVVFGESVQLLTALPDMLPGHRTAVLHGHVTALARDHVIRAFREQPDLRVLACTSAGERGLNLQVASMVVHLDLPWNPARIRQRIGRVRRHGAAHQVVRSVFLVARGTVEARILEVLGGKQSLASHLIETPQDTAGDAIAITAAEARKILEARHGE